MLANWAGLGYYSRARNLQRAAKEIEALHAGEFPRNYEAALALPGIGTYTAAAVLSIAYGAPYSVLDGNVARVLARIGAVRGDLRTSPAWKRLQEAARQLLARKTSGDWNQAMMELGATVCTPKSPRCEECPVSRWCRAHKLGVAESLPSTRKKRGIVNVTLAAAVLLDPHGRTLLTRPPNGDGALFSRMWQFPAIETKGTNSWAALARHLHETVGVAIKEEPVSLGTARHSVTFRSVRLEPYLVRVARLPKLAGARVVSLSRMGRVPISNATRKIADAARRDESK